MDLSIKGDIVHLYIYDSVKKKRQKYNYSGIYQERSYPKACTITPGSRILVKTRSNKCNARTNTQGLN